MEHRHEYDFPRRQTVFGLGRATQHLNLSEEQQFRRKVEDFTKGTPRFLFRFWSHESGGNAKLNTIDAVTPLKFLGRPGPVESFYEAKPESLYQLARGHVRWSHIPTAYSSWSHSLAFVLDFARNLLHERTGVNICILDTTKLDPANVILHTSAVGSIFGRYFPDIEQEFLVYGVVSGPAYRAISFESFQSPPWEAPGLGYGRGQGLSGILKQDTVEDKIRKIVEIARTFGGSLEVPVAAHMMAFVLGKIKDAGKHREYLERIYSALPVPQEWRTDRTIMGGGVHYHGVMEAYRATKLLREVVRIKYKLEAPKPRKLAAAPKNHLSPPIAETERDAKLTKAEVDKATKSVTESDRLPAGMKKSYSSMVSQLTITMKRFQENNKQIKEHIERRA